MYRLLVIRFSAMGDVAMTVPVVAAAARQHPEWEITVLSNVRLAALFEQLPHNVTFFGADLRGRHRGVKGLRLLLQDIGYRQFDAVADLHDVLRTRYLRWRFRLAGIPIRTIDKGRWGKWRLTRRYAKVFRPLKPSVSRYADVLQVALPPTALQPSVGRAGIGIAPFAAHKGKIYPLSQMEQVVRQLRALTSETIYLFGSKSEAGQLRSWEQKMDRVVNLAGTLPLEKELLLMHSLRVMVTMDSANMHLASLVGTPVVSVWGATHPYAGFLGYGQREDDCVQVDLPCRPCSIYGNKACYRGDYACLQRIEPRTIVNKVQTYLS